MIDLQESDVSAGKLFDRGLLRRLFAYVRPYQRHLALAILLVVPMALLMNFMPLLLRDATDNYLGATGLPVEQRIAGVGRIALQFLGLGVAAFFLRFAQGYLMVWIGQKILYDLRADIFSKILRLPARYFDRNPVGRLITRISSDVDAMQRLLTDGLVGATTDLFSLMAVLGFMVYVSPRLASILLALFLPLLVVLVFLNERVRAAHRQVRMRQSQTNAYLQEMLTGMQTIQLFNREQAANLRFDHHNSGLRAAFLRSVKWFSYAFPATEIMYAVTVALVLGYGGWRLMRGEADVTLGVLVAYLAYIRDFFRPLDDLSEKSNILQSAMASSERVFSLLDVPEEILDPAQPVPLRRLQGSVEFDRVWFAYDPDNWVLKNLSLSIRAGESLAFVGATGAGKSSVISLIARFYDVQRGVVKVDGQDVRQYAQADLRRHIGLVLQDPFIFSGTILDNITLHNPAVTREKAIEAARFVNAHAFITERAGGYDAPVQERGAGLSTGQKQLLAFARALAQNPDILLILDEATASVDTETELLIQDALRKMMKGRTSIIIAHRLSTIRHVDRILVMRHGEVVEEGSHQALLRLDGYYRRLYELLSHEPTAK
jgi:ATP-binding cassette subfamily B protein